MEEISPVMLWPIDALKQERTTRAPSRLGEHHLWDSQCDVPTQTGGCLALRGEGPFGLHWDRVLCELGLWKHTLTGMNMHP